MWKYADRWKRGLCVHTPHNCRHLATRPSSACVLTLPRHRASRRHAGAVPPVSDKQPPCPALGQGRAAALNGGQRPIWARWAQSKRRALFGESWGLGRKAAPAPPWVTHKAQQCSPLERRPQASLHQAGGEPCNPLEQRAVSQGFPPACVCEPAYQPPGKGPHSRLPTGRCLAHVWPVCRSRVGPS